jgi:hypothetical protein
MAHTAAPPALPGGPVKGAGMLSSPEGKSLMKKVRYAAGALGALGVVPALGLLTPAAAASDIHAPAGKDKTVSMSPSRTGHKSVSLVPLNTGCTGATLAQTSSDTTHTKLKFWYTRHSSLDTCIGTIEVSYDTIPLLSGIRYRIWDHSAYGKKFLASSNSTGLYAGGGRHHATFAIHKSFGYSPIQVCTARVSSVTGQTASVMCIAVK